MDIGGTRQLLGAAGQAGVAHFLYVSIVGVRHARVPYLRLKAAAEDLVRQSGVPHSIVPSTQFYWLLDRMLGRMARLAVWPLPAKLPMQPADEGDFAAYVAGCVADGPGGDRQPFGGPGIMSFGEVAGLYRAARGLRRRILPVPRIPPTRPTSLQHKPAAWHLAGQRVKAGWRCTTSTPRAPPACRKDHPCIKRYACPITKSR